jgi:hypothetical protein
MLWAHSFHRDCCIILSFFYAYHIFFEFFGQDNAPVLANFDGQFKSRQILNNWQTFIFCQKFSVSEVEHLVLSLPFYMCLISMRHKQDLRSQVEASTLVHNGTVYMASIHKQKLGSHHKIVLWL